MGPILKLFQVRTDADERSMNRLATPAGKHENIHGGTLTIKGPP